MATILTKKKDTSGAPSAGDLTNSTGGAELAVNTADKRLYTKDSGGNVVEIGINPTSITTGTLNTSGAVVFNDAGADVDFRVEGDTNANLLFVDASTDRIGVGTNAPDNKLTIADSASIVAGKQWGLDFQDVAKGEPQAFMYAEGRYSANYNTDLVFGNIHFTGSAAERMRLTSDNYLRLAAGGIQFNGDTAAANALDDYEEGTFSPTLTTTGTDFTSVTYDPIRSGVYTKIGNVVAFRLRMFTDAVTVGSASGDVVIGNLPFTAVAGQPIAVAVGFVTAWAGEQPSAGIISQSNTIINIYYRSTADGITQAVQIADVGTGTNDNLIDISGCYFAA